MFTRLGKFIGFVSDAPLHTELAVVGSVLVFGALEFAVHEALSALDVPPLADVLVDALLVGLSAGFAVWILLIGNRDRRRRVRQELERIAELNHEIRNALQVITHSQFNADGTVREMVMESVSRIDAVLTRVAPAVGGITPSSADGRKRLPPKLFYGS